MQGFRRLGVADAWARTQARVKRSESAFALGAAQTQNPCRVHRHSSDNYADDKGDDERDSRMTGSLSYRARAGLREHVGLRRLCASPGGFLRPVPVWRDI